MSKMISRSGIPIGTSMRPVFVIAPASAKTFVPRLFGVPIFANHSGPLRRIVGMFASVSTLLMSVG